MQILRSTEMAHQVNIVVRVVLLWGYPLFWYEILNEESIKINSTMQYETESHNTLLGNKAIKIENLTPKFADAQKKQVKQLVEESLYNIFKKYQ